MNLGVHAAEPLGNGGRSTSQPWKPLIEVQRLQAGTHLQAVTSRQCNMRFADGYVSALQTPAASGTRQDNPSARVFTQAKRQPHACTRARLGPYHQFLANESVRPIERRRQKDFQILQVGYRVQTTGALFPAPAGIPIYAAGEARCDLRTDHGSQSRR